MTITDTIMDHVGDDISFIQIGACDGMTGDPLRACILSNPRWEGVVVEPNPVVFEELKKNYAEQADRIEFSSEAIVPTPTGSSPFYYFAPDAALKLTFPPGRTQRVFNQYGSLYETYCNSRTIPYEKSNLHPLLIKKLDTMHNLLRTMGVWVSTEVQTLTIDELMVDTLGIPDLLVVDAGGSDLEIIRSLHNFPDFVLYHHSSEFVSEEDQEVTEAFLYAHEYLLKYLNTGGKEVEERSEAWYTFATQIQPIDSPLSQMAGMMLGSPLSRKGTIV
jgi:hypothetical protein